MEFVSNLFKTQEICTDTVSIAQYLPEYVPDQCNTQEMCIRIVEEDQCQLLCVTEWFVTQDLLWHDSDGYCDDHEFVNWLNGYKQFKAQKPQIKKESIPIA